MKPYIRSSSHLLRSTYLRMHRVTNRVLRPHGVTADQYVLLRILGEGDGISQQDLAHTSASDPTTVGRMLELLEQKDYVERRPLPTDRRTRLVFLTEAGRRMMDELYEAARPICDALDAALSGSALRTLQRALIRLSDLFEEMEAETDDSTAARKS